MGPRIPLCWVSQRCLLPTEPSDVAFSKTQNEWKQILFGAFCYTLHQGWLQNQARGSLLMLMMMITTAVSLADIHLFNQASRTISQEPAQCWALYVVSTRSKHLNSGLSISPITPDYYYPPFTDEEAGGTESCSKLSSVPQMVTW